MNKDNFLQELNEELEAIRRKSDFTKEEMQTLENVGSLVQQLFSLHSPIRIDAFSVSPEIKVQEFFGDDLETFEKVLFHFIEEWEYQEGVRVYLNMEEDQIFDVFETVQDITIYFFYVILEQSNEQN